MCTAMSDNRECHLFGRTLDLECSFGERIVRIGRNFKLNFLREKASVSHYAIIGTAHIYEGMPFFYDAANEKGLAMAALNFPGLAVYREPRKGVLNLASFELIWWVLSKCSDLSEARIELKRVNVTSDAISDTMPATPLHWMIADKSGAIVIEPTQDGIKIYDAPFGVMTNSPEYPYHILTASGSR